MAMARDRRKPSAVGWPDRLIRGQQLALFSRGPVFIVRNYWSRDWHIQDPHGYAVKDAMYPAPELAVRAAVAEGFQVVLVEQFPGQRFAR